MPTSSLEAATKKLTHAVEEMHADDLVQIYNELFPDDPASEDEADDDVTPLVEQIVEHMTGGLEPEEVVDLWSVAFPGNREVYYNEEDGLLHYDEGNEEP